MVECIILYRIGEDPVQPVTIIDLDGEDTGQIREFRDRDEAVEWLEHHPSYNSGAALYQIVELDEL